MNKAERAHLARWAHDILSFVEQCYSEREYAGRWGALRGAVMIFADYLEADQLPIIISPDFVGPIQQS